MDPGNGIIFILQWSKLERIVDGMHSNPVFALVAYLATQIQMLLFINYCIDNLFCAENVSSLHRCNKSYLHY